MLLHAMWAKAVNLENRVIDTIADAIGSVVPVGIERRAQGADRAGALAACQDQACLIADSRRI